ncbi:MAG: hypothetical protein RI919_909, partial [Actinomycetota bacterium]
MRDARQNLILEAASQLVCEGSAEAVTMATLARSTGLSRPAIYQYFASREHVLAELVINELADFSNEVDRHLAGIAEPMEQIRVWIHYSLAHLASEEHRFLVQEATQAAAVQATVLLEPAARNTAARR